MHHPKITFDMTSKMSFFPAPATFSCPKGPSKWSQNNFPLRWTFGCPSQKHCPHPLTHPHTDVDAPPGKGHGWAQARATGRSPRTWARSRRLRAAGGPHTGAHSGKPLPGANGRPGGRAIDYPLDWWAFGGGAMRRRSPHCQDPLSPLP